MTFKQQLINFIDSVCEIWDKLPTEVRASVYLTISYEITQAIDQLNILHINNVVLMALVNILLVFLKNLKTRVPVISDKVKSLLSK